MSDTIERLHAKVRGRVQGVSFRYYTTQQARSLGLTGWVMNLPDGQTVEVTAEGSREDLLSLLDWLNTGPGGARVDNLDSAWQTATGEFSDFRTRYNLEYD